MSVERLVQRSSWEIGSDDEVKYVIASRDTASGPRSLSRSAL